MSKEFKQLLDTVGNGTEPNWDAIMGIVEMIKKKEYSAKKATTEIRKKLLDAKESTVLNAMFLVEAIVKNTPSSLHRDFLSPELLGSMKALVEGQNSGMSRAIDKVLEVLGEWKAAFGDDNAYKAVTNMFNELERGGYYIPEATVASASYIKKGPDFQESENCYLCDKKFGKLGTRRHHCRNCGKSICGSCEGDRKIDLPHLDFDSPQIVCITCFKKLDKTTSSSTDPPETSRTGPSPQPTPVPSSDQERQLQEEEELQMAIAISLNEQENKKKKTSVPFNPPVSNPSPPASFVPPTTTTPSAPPPSSSYTPIYADLDFSTPQPVSTGTGAAAVPIVSNNDQRMTEFEQYTMRGQRQKAATEVLPTQQQQQSDVTAAAAIPICSTLNKVIDQFVNRMQLISGKGENIATDQAVLSMHQDLTALHLQLLQQIDETQEKKADQERILHKIEESKEARVTFDTMKRRHDEQLLQQEREQQALAQMQVQMKLALLRQQKAEQMAYGQTMQSERLNRLSNQRAMYEKTIASQRESERLKLISLEEQVYQQQFGKPMTGHVAMETAPYVAPPPTLYSGPPPPAPIESFASGYSGPSKMDPPPYQPIQPPTLYQPQPPPPELAPPPLAMPNYVPYIPSGQYVPPPSLAPPTLPYASSNDMYQAISEAPPPPEEPPLLQRVPSVPPLISFD